ncbi:hypothetical protein [Rhodoplanes sp.]|uniref:non-homologous end-joining DNA ligase LigD n=1 Tax=Rhodoplanes sp. TaxID=1968906 RepID=UPI00345C11A3
MRRGRLDDVEGVPQAHHRTNVGGLAAEGSRQDGEERARGKIVVDHLRKGRGATALVACSPRARPGAPVSTSVAWSEVPAKLSPARWTVLNLTDRLERLQADPWAEIGTVRQRNPGT